jgi:hypothetical protein
MSQISRQTQIERRKNIISCNYGKENSLEIGGFLVSVAVEGIDGDIFYQLNFFDVLEFMCESEYKPTKK